MYFTRFFASLVALASSDGVLTVGVCHLKNFFGLAAQASDGVLTAGYFTNHFADAGKMVFGWNAEGGNIFSHSWEAFAFIRKN